MNIEQVSLFFQFCAYLCMKFGNAEAVGRIQIGKKKHHTKHSFIYNIGRFGCRKEVWLSQVGLVVTNVCCNYSLSQGIDGFISFQAIKIVSMFVIFQIVACLRTKFGNIEAIDRLQIRKKKYLAKRHLHRENW